MNRLPLISVCVPVFGVELFIARCAESLFSQTMTEGVEYIFVDDATPDRSIAVLNEVIRRHPEIADRVHIITHERNRGLAVARRTAVGAARGAYIAHVDSDDWVEPDFLQTLYDATIRDEADVSVCNCIDEFDGYSHEQDFHALSFSEDADLGLEILLGHIPVYMWGKLIRRSLYESYPECFTPDGIGFYEDKYSMCRLMHHANRMAWIGRPLVHHDMANQGSMTHNLSRKSVADAMRFISDTRAFFNACYSDGRYAELLDSRCVFEKAVMLHFCRDMNVRREYADLFKDECSRYIKTLSTGLRISATLILSHQWVLLRLFQLLSDAITWADGLRSKVSYIFRKNKTNHV